MVRMPLLLAGLLSFCAAALAQNPPPLPTNPQPTQTNPDPDSFGRPPSRQLNHAIERTGSVGNPDTTAKQLGATGSEVTDLNLPKNFEVDYDEMFVDISAECKGPVTWLVVSTSEKIKYKLAKDGDTTVTVGVPPHECVISVFCVGFVDGHFTNWARTDVYVHGPQAPPGPQPTPGPQPQPQTPPQQTHPMPLPVGSRLQYTIIEDVRARTYQTKSIIESPNVRQAIGPTNIFRVRDVSDPVVATFIAFIQKKQVPLPALFVQINDGTRTPKPPLWYGPLPHTEAEMIALIQSLQGGR
jgi:hypothetical protein